ncbi:hypothetical protein CF319_g7419 [Tilletia indica]|nr:hypothetical protein CF319_g7419 [Tilletia indica]
MSSTDQDPMSDGKARSSSSDGQVDAEITAPPAPTTTTTTAQSATPPPPTDQHQHQHDSELTSISLEEDHHHHPAVTHKPPSIELSRASLHTPTTTTGTHTPYEVFADRTTDTSQLLSDNQPVILGIAVVDFNHLVGPQIEFAHPNSLLDDQDLSTNLPFLALPDGSHLSDEDFCYFHLHASNLSPSTIFGISCNRQIASDALLRKGAEVTRSTVQKAVVVLAREPVFGPIREKLGIVTRAFFAQGDLADINILIDFHATLEAGLKSGGFSSDREAALYMGTSLREFIHKWRSKTLVLVKMLLLQRNIMFYGYPIEQLCTQQYSLVSLIPGLLASLQDAGLPNLDTRTSTRAPAESLRTSDRKSLLRFLGLPLNLFAKDAFFQPYLPLQQIDLLKGSTYLVGTSNSIYRQQKDCAIDVIVDLEHSTLEFVNPLAQRLSALTAPDRKWMAELENLVLSTWNPADPTRPAGMQYEGSDDHLRARFEEYICALLASVKHYQFDRKVGKGDAALAGASGSSTHAFGTDFLEAFMRTKAFPSWNDSTDPMIFDIIDHRHPCDGKTSAIEDVGLRLAAGLQDMHLEENLAPARQVVVSALSQGGAGLFRFANGLRSEVVKLREGRLASSGEVEGGGGSANTTSSTSSRPASMTLSAAGGADKRTSVSSSTSSVNNKDLPASPPLPSPSPLSPASFMSGFRIPGTSSSTTSTSSSSQPTGADGGGGGHPSSSSSSATATQIADVASQTADRAAQAAAQAGTQVRAALGNFGSFLAKQQRQWAAPAPAPASSASGSTSTSTSTVPGGSVATSLKSTTTSAGNTAVAAAAGLGSWATSLVGGSASSASSSAGAPSGVSAKTTLPAPPLPPAPLAKDVPELPLPPPPTGGKEKQVEEEEVYVVDDGFDTVSRESVAESDTATAPPADEKDVPTTTTTYPPLPAVRSP